MWIVSHDKPYYPRIYKFTKEEDAIKEYEDIKKDIENNEDEYYQEECVFISEVKELYKGSEYDMSDDIY